MKDSFVKVITRGVQALAFYKAREVLDLETIELDTVVFPKNIAQRVMAEKRGENVLEFVSVWLESYKFAWDRQRTPVARKGLYGNYLDDTKLDITEFKSVPVDLEYSIWYWSKDYDKILKLVERIMFWQHQNPRLEILVNDLYPVEFYMSVADVIDESPVENMFEKGLYFVAKQSLKLEGWIFDQFSLKSVKQIIIKVWNDIVPPELLFQEVIEG
jgi:hypothetical protein